MAEANNNYKRLPGRGSGLASISRLFLGSDHLLLVETQGYSESYRRFYFQDVQAFFIRRTATWIVITIVAVSFAVFFGWISWLVDDLSRVLWLSLVGVSIGALILNLILGPTCACHIKTAVQLDELPSLKRWKHAHRIFGQLKPLIEAAQGTLTAETLQQQLAAVPPIIAPVASPAPIKAPEPTAYTPVVPLPLAYYDGRLHAVLFYLLLVDVVLSLLSLRFTNAAFDALGAFWMLAAFCLSLVAIFKQSRTTLSPAVKLTTWLTLGYVLVTICAVVVYGIYVAFKDPERIGDRLTAVNDPVTMTMLVVTTLCSAVLGTMGLLQLRRFRRDQAPQGTVPPVLSNPPAS